MKKYISILLSAILLGLTSCDVIKEELGLDDIFNNDNKDDNKDEEKKPQVNVNKNPCAYFTFDGNYDDLSGNDNYAYGNPEPTFVSGPAAGKKAIAFSRSNMTKVVVNDGLVDTPSMTISFWMKDISEGDIFYVTSSIEYQGSTRMMYLSYRNGSLKYVMTRSNNLYHVGEITSFTHKAIDDGEWHHIALVSDHNMTSENQLTKKLYVDGVLMDTITEYCDENTGSNHFGTGTKFIMGGDNTPNMKIANLRVYDEWQLPVSEIKNLYDKKL